MYPCKRRFDVRSIGVWLLPVGRPTKHSERRWVQRCNFVFKTSARVETLQERDDPVEIDRNAGWMITMYTPDGASKECYMPSECASSNVMLRKRLMGMVQGAICRMTADDFLAFVDEDSQEDLPVVQVATHCGKIHLNGTHVWAFPSITLDATGRALTRSPVHVSAEMLRTRSNGDRIALPADFPAPKPRTSGVHSLTELSRAMNAYYGPRRMHAMHLLVSILKAIHYDTLLKVEHFVPITNISGPPNVGKTFACSIALTIVNAPSLMLSRCTPSAMIDAAHVFRNMLLVWDDPRDCTQSQISSIVHEAFNGLATSTISRGVRRYSSALIIGTQDPLLGMQYNPANVATFSRLSHIDMDIATKWTPPASAEPRLQRCMQTCDDIFAALLNTHYDTQKVNRLYDKLKRAQPDIIHRSLRIAAIDWFFCDTLVHLGFDVHENDVADYFLTTYANFLKTHCSRLAPIDQFCRHVRQLVASRHDIPKHFFKDRVLVDLKHFGPTECCAFYTKDFFPFLHKHIPSSTALTKEQIHSHLKHSPKHGEVSRNVAFPTESNSVQIKRSIVIRRNFIF